MASSVSEVALVGEEVAVASNFSSGDLQELDQKCVSVMEKAPGKNAHKMPLYRCKVCGKEDISGSMKRHIEAKHLDVSIPCNFCEKTFRSRNSLTDHTCKNHKDCKDNMLFTHYIL